MFQKTSKTPAGLNSSMSVDGISRHEQDRHELQHLISLQRERIEKLKRDSAVQLQHKATLQRLALEEARDNALQEISTLSPQLELLRVKWTQSREANSSYESHWGSMRSHLQQARGRVEALTEQLQAMEDSKEQTSQSVREMRTQLQQLERDISNTRHGVQSALEALVVDDEMLRTRLQEEEAYHVQMQQALTAMRVEYNDSLEDTEQELVPLREDLDVLKRYLEEMQQRTAALRKHCVDLDARAFRVEQRWIESVQTTFGSLERANQRVAVKVAVLSALEQQLKEMAKSRVAPRQSNGHADTLWLSNSFAVWDSIVKKEVSQQRQKLQLQEEGTMLLAKTSQANEAAKAELAQLRRAVEGDGYERRQLLRDIGELNYLLNEKKKNENQMMQFVQDLCTQLDEKVPLVLTYIRRDGFDDCVSSTDEEEVLVGGGFAELAEEPVEDDGALTSSLELDPDDPKYHEMVRRMSHRPQGPLTTFSQDKARYLWEHGGGAAAAGRASSSHPQSQQQTAAAAAAANPKEHRETLERKVMELQQRLSDEVVMFVRNRTQQIQSGLLDPRNERLNADPTYAEWARRRSQRVEDMMQQQKQLASTNDATPTLLLAANRSHYGNTTTTSSGGGSSLSPIPLRGSASTNRQPIVIEGDRTPMDVRRGNPLTKVQFFVNHAVRGLKSLTIPRTTMVPELRHTFLSRDLSRIISRRPQSTASTTSNEDASIMLVSEVTNILLGHRTDVFHEARVASRYTLREDLAFSFVSIHGTTLDIECDSHDDRQYWASIFAWIVNESMSGGILDVLRQSQKLTVVDTRNQTPESVEVQDRQFLQVRTTS